MQHVFIVFLSFIHYILFITVVLQNFMQLITITYYFTITACLRWNCFPHVTPYTGYIIHKHGTMYLHGMKDSVKL
jgi:hypothetical protein